MLVRYWMTRDPQSVTSTTPLSDLVDLVRSHNLRRFPVVDQGKLCGMITLSDIYRFASKQSVHKADPSSVPAGKLGDHAVAEAMTKDPHTCAPNDPIEGIGEVMRQRRIHALPVIQNNCLAGIITESDIMRALARICSLHSDAERIYLRVKEEEKLGQFHSIFELCKRYQVELVTLLTHPLAEEGGELVLLRVRGKRVKELVEALWSRKYSIIHTVAGRCPGVGPL